MSDTNRWAFLRQAARTRRLSGNAWRVLITATAELDGETFRPFKQTALAHQLGVAQPHVSSGIRQLVRVGLLERGAPDGSSYTYRLRLDGVQGTLPRIRIQQVP